MKFDIGIVRGLDYYTGIVFEAFDTERKFRAIFGGGRYDHLLEDAGARAMTAVGLGFGDVVLMDFLSEKGVQLHYRDKTDYAISYLEDAQQKIAIQIAQALRANGKSVDMALHSEKPKHFFARAGKSKISEAIFIGPDDIRSGIIRIKDLDKRVESEMQLSELLS
jgi:histidyl-tRNA synthetase